MTTRDDVAAALDRFERRPVDRPDLQRSAVAITLVEEPGGLAFLLTRRATALRRHAGQWALPGGRTDPGEGPTRVAHLEQPPFAWR